MRQEKPRITPFLTFPGNAEQAMKFYAENLPGAKITKLARYGKDNPHAGPGDAERILHGELSLFGQDIMFLDMDAANPPPDFSWAMCIYLDCASEAEFDAVFAPLAKEGTVMMGPEPVENIRKCAWVTDKFGVTWQPVWE